MLQPVTKGENKNRIIKYTNPKECIPVGGGSGTGINTTKAISK